MLGILPFILLLLTTTTFSSTKDEDRMAPSQIARVALPLVGIQQYRAHQKHTKDHSHQDHAPWPLPVTLEEWKSGSPISVNGLLQRVKDISRRKEASKSSANSALDVQHLVSKVVKGVKATPHHHLLSCMSMASHFTPIYYRRVSRATVKECTFC